MGISVKTLNEIEKEMYSYLLNVDDINYRMLCEPFVFESKPSSMNEIEMQRASYLLNVDDMNYSMLYDPMIMRYKTDINPDKLNIRGLEKYLW